MKLIIFLIIILLISACSKYDSADIIHPTEENLTLVGSHNSAVLNVNEMVEEKDLETEKASYFQQLSNINKTLSIGVQYGDENQMFGQIQDVALDSLHRIYILDSHKQDIRVFNASGEYLTTVGRRGRGPGEFQLARSMAIYNNEFLFVSNGYQIEVYNIANESIEYSETIQFDKNIYSICVIDDQLYLHSSNPLDFNDISEEKNYTNMIHAYSLPLFEYQFSFGQSYKSTDFFVIERLTMGNISCNDVSSTVIFAFERMQILHGYSAIDGKLIWKNRIDGLSLMAITEKDEGGRPSLTFGIPENNVMDQMAATKSISAESEYELFQVIRADIPEIGVDRTSEVHSFLLNSSNGDGVYIGKKIPEIKFILNNKIASRDLSDGYTVCRIYESDFHLSP
jgi:hypothetical protein